MSREELMKRFGVPLPLRGAAKFARETIKKPLMVAEVGVADGRNAFRMLKELEIERLYLIDSYPNYMDGLCVRKGELQEAYYNAMFINMQSYLSKVTMITRDSLYAATLFKNEFFDFVYIDGNHSYSQCKKDIEAWWPKVINGGILSGHDIGHVDYPGVAKAVEEFAKKQLKEIIQMGDSDWIIKK